MEEYFFEKSFFDDLYLYNIGHQKCAPSHQFGPSIREDYILHFIVDGSGTFTVEGTKYELSKSDFFLLRPSVVTDYEASADTPWEYYWIGFNGNKVEEVLRYLKIDSLSHVGEAKNEALVLERFKHIFSPNLLSNSNQLLIQQYLYDILSVFHSEVSKNDLSDEEQRRYSYSFVTYVKHYYRKPDLKISEIAQSFGLNKSYFSQVIKQEMGMTPNDYLRFFRMQESCNLLQRSNKSVKEIAYLVGYENPLTFSRAFKNYHGVSPLEYRKKAKESKK